MVLEDKEKELYERVIRVLKESAELRKNFSANTYFPVSTDPQIAELIKQVDKLSKMHDGHHKPKPSIKP